MESAPGYLFKFFFIVLITLFLLTVSVAVLQYSDKNNFEQYVNATIERNGGLTSAAVSDIQAYSSTTFNNRFRLLTGQTEKKAFGDSIAYSYEIKITPVFMQFDALKFTDNGIAVSKVR